MADEIDRAQDAEARNLSHALDAQRVLASLTPKMQPTGYCHSPVCGDEFPANDNRLFCGRECADDHQRFATRRAA